MSADPSQIRLTIQNARQALRRGDQTAARRLAEQAAQLAPELEDPWLLLAAVSGPRESLAHAQRALAINPSSQRAHTAVEWANKRLGIEPPIAPPVESPVEPPIKKDPVSKARAPVAKAEAPAPKLFASLPVAEVPAETPLEESPQAVRPRTRLVPILLLVGLVCAVVAFAAWSVSKSSALASIVRNSNDPAPTRTLESNFAQAEISKPTYTPEWTFTPTLTATPRFTVTPSLTSTPEFTSTPLPTDTPLPTETPGVMEAAIIADTPTPVNPPTSTAPTQKAYNPPSNVGSGTHWIDINLSEQRLYAYEGDTIVNSFLVSTGVAGMATPTGTFKIYARYLYADMHGPGYYLPDVPYTQYFYKSYGIHGTYWHNNFGVPMSHGCVNLSIPDAGWLYNWSTFGTTVVIHY